MIRILVILVSVMLAGTVRAANSVSFEGNPGWSINNTRCTFLIPGNIVNHSPAGSVSGTLRLVLWVSSAPFPSSGYRVATYKIGQLRGGYQYSNIQPYTSCSIPKITGNYHFTVILEQYGNNGWSTSDFSAGSVKTLKKGSFVKPKEWKAPSGKVVKPLKKLKPGQNLNLTLQGSKSDGALVYVPNGSRLKLRVAIEANGRTTVYGGSKPQGAPALYTYGKSTARYGGKKNSVGRIALDYGAFFGVESTSTYSLFFQKSNKGFYKGVDTDQGSAGESWGIFSVN